MQKESLYHPNELTFS